MAKNSLKRAQRRLRHAHTITTPETLMPLLRDRLAAALGKAGISATIVHDTQHQLVKLSNLQHRKALATGNPEYGLLVHYTPKGLHVVVFSQPAADKPMRLIFSKSGQLTAILAELFGWKNRNETAAELPLATYRVVAEQLRQLAAAYPALIP